MDTFAFRCPELAKLLLVFEVDDPITQAYKRTRISVAGWGEPDQLHFVPVDFSRDSLLTALVRASYDPDALSFFSLLGFTSYFDRKTVLSVMSDISCIAAAGSTLVFDYLDNDAFVPGKATKRIQVEMEYFRDIGVPMITSFESATLASELQFLGFTLRENLNPGEIERRYFQDRSDGFHAYEHMHFAHTEVKRKYID